MSLQRKPDEELRTPGEILSLMDSDHARKDSVYKSQLDAELNAALAAQAGDVSSRSLGIARLSLWVGIIALGISAIQFFTASPGTPEIDEETYARQIEDYDRQTQATERQLARTDAQLRKAESQGERLDALIALWEQQGSRQDDILAGIELLMKRAQEPKNNQAEQDGADQPATAPESKPEGDSEPKSESEGRSQ